MKWTAILLVLIGVGLGSWVGASKMSSAADEPPTDLFKTGAMIGTAAKAVQADLKKSWYDWDTLEKSLTIKRRERPAITDDFVEQVQTIDVGRFVIDASWRCDRQGEIREIFAAEIDVDGTSVIERFRFLYPAKPGAYTPIDQRPMPRAQRQVIYQGDDLGRIRSLRVDPKGRYLLFLTRENPALYRIELTTPPSAPAAVLTSSELPYLAKVGWINMRQHRTEGLHVHLIPGSPWEIHRGPDSDVIILRDPENDGTFETADLVSEEAWSQLGYDSSDPWIRLCH
ncbi:MAG: hypothetical protein RL885_17880 [Planctomycetota bacterium]